MADVYKFRVNLCDFEDIIWRDIEITSISSVAKLGYSVLASFESLANHLFNIRYNDDLYEIVFEDAFEDEAVIDPIETKLSDLKLSVGDILMMVYDYGAGWEFEIELLSITLMKKGAHAHYPYIVDGKGRGIIEDTSPCELSEIVENTDKNEIIPEIWDVYLMEMIKWDYRLFDLEYSNKIFKKDVRRIQHAYEKML